MKITEIPNDKIQLKIPKFKCDECLTKRDITPYPNKSFFMIIAGTMGSGKTSFLISSLTSKHVWRKCFSNIFVVMPPSSRASLKKNPFKHLKSDRLYDELDYDTLAEINETIDDQETDEETDERPTNLIIIDDQTQFLKQNDIQRLLRHMVLNMRHKRLSIIILTQYLNAIPLALRKNASNIVLANRPKNSKEIQSIIGEYMGLEKQKGLDILDYTFKKKYDKLFMNLNEDDGVHYYRNFNRLKFDDEA
tara:strand:+ start:7057 stop:7803 length:747 start_codon:yes stop_codon:yes gene_type:complete